MIVSYRNKETEQFSSGERGRAYESVERIGRLKLNKLKAAHALADMVNLPGNCLERLRGDREAQFRIALTIQWRICFEWDAEAQGFANVEIVDHH